MANEVPQYMNQESQGPHVTLLQSFLYGARLGNGVEFDGNYGSVTASKVAQLQEELEVETDGHFGPQTRVAVRDVYGFNFEAACQVIPGTTSFVQPDGKVIEWRPTPEEVVS